MILKYNLSFVTAVRKSDAHTSCKIRKAGGMLGHYHVEYMSSCVLIIGCLEQQGLRERPFFSNFNMKVENLKKKN